MHHITSTYSLLVVRSREPLVSSGRSGLALVSAAAYYTPFRRQHESRLNEGKGEEGEGGGGRKEEKRKKGKERGRKEKGTKEKGEESTPRTKRRKSMRKDIESRIQGSGGAERCLRHFLAPEFRPSARWACHSVTGNIALRHKKRLLVLHAIIIPPSYRREEAWFASKH